MGAISFISIIWALLRIEIIEIGRISIILIFFNYLNNSTRCGSWLGKKKHRFQLFQLSGPFCGFK